VIPKAGVSTNSFSFPATATFFNWPSRDDLSFVIIASFLVQANGRRMAHVCDHQALYPDA
jgi:hypothetical protein